MGLWCAFPSSVQLTTQRVAESTRDRQIWSRGKLNKIRTKRWQQGTTCYFSTYRLAGHKLFLKNTSFKSNDAWSKLTGKCFIQEGRTGMKCEQTLDHPSWEVWCEFCRCRDKNGGCFLDRKSWPLTVHHWGIFTQKIFYQPYSTMQLRFILRNAAWIRNIQNKKIITSQHNWALLPQSHQTPAWEPAAQCAHVLLHLNGFVSCILNITEIYFP